MECFLERLSRLASDLQETWLSEHSSGAQPPFLTQVTSKRHYFCPPFHTKHLMVQFTCITISNGVRHTRRVFTKLRNNARITRVFITYRQVGPAPICPPSVVALVDRRPWPMDGSCRKGSMEMPRGIPSLEFHPHPRKRTGLHPSRDLSRPHRDRVARRLPGRPRRPCRRAGRPIGETWRSGKWKITPKTFTQQDETWKTVYLQNWEHFQQDLQIKIFSLQLHEGRPN